MSSTKKAKSNTTKTWSLKGIENETRQAVTKAAKKKGITIGAYVNAVLMEAAVKDLKGKAELPVKMEDIQTQLSDMNKSIAMLAEKMENKPKKTLIERLFKDK